MNDPYFFGYGSLVNRATHAYPDPRRASLDGWRRAWVRTPGRATVFLTGVPAVGSRISGLIARVPLANWAALDRREAGYARVSAGAAVSHDLPGTLDIAVYAVPTTSMQTGGDHVILLSYLDVVVQGFLREFGKQGVEDFFATTDGWETPVLDDRAKPRYPRAQRLGKNETALVDDQLAAVSTAIVAPE